MGAANDHEQQADAERRRLMRPVADAIVASRTRRGWSRAELARRAGVSASSITRIERCDCDPYLGTITRILDALELRWWRPHPAPKVSGDELRAEVGRLAADPEAAAESRRILRELADLAPDDEDVGGAE